MRSAPAQLSPQNPSRLLRRAQRVEGEGALARAERLYAALLAYDAGNADALHGLGRIHYRRGRLDKALALIQAALTADPRRADGFASLGLVFHALGDFERALTSYDEGLRLAPGDGDLLNQLRNRRGVALLGLRRPQAALDDFDRVLAVEPGNVDALGNRGNALLKVNRPAEAVEAYERALERAPKNAQLLTNRAIALRRLDRPHEALLSVTAALALAPAFAPARFVDGALRLALGDFAAGWRGYEWRWGGAMAAQRRNFSAPLWLGETPLAGKTILLHAEQGFGDTLHFVRYAPLVAARGAKVVLEVQPQLLRLLAATPGAAAVLARNALLPAFDLQCPLASLPLAFATDLASIPPPVPYPEPGAAAVARWRALVPQRAGRRRVAFAWSGARSHDNDLNRSLRLQTLLPLFDLPGVDFISFQHEVRDEDAALLKTRSDIVHIGPQFADFADTAAALSLVDMVISPDTALAHLAATMGKPLYLLLPLAADFRWLRERADSPWYPAARLFRQPGFGDWDGVVAAVRGELHCMFHRPAAA